AAKYEAAHGASGAQSWELSHHGSSVPGLQNWWGHCNGWAAAAVLFAEPHATMPVGSTAFGVADQKSLLSEIAMEVDAAFFGSRANSDGSSDPAFQDIYPDQWFLVMTNYMGAGLPIIIDRYTGLQVW